MIKIQCILLAAFILLLVMLAQTGPVSALQAQPPTPATTLIPTSTAVPSPIPSPTPSATPPLPERISTLEAQVIDLNNKIANPPKDNWERANLVAPIIAGSLTATATLISGILLAVIGHRAAVRFNERKQAEDLAANERKRVNDEAIKERELTISRADIINKFMPQLSSGDEKQRQSALEVISTLDVKAAIKLATIFADDPGIQVLGKIANNPNFTDDERDSAQLLQTMMTKLSFWDFIEGTFWPKGFYVDQKLNERFRSPEELQETLNRLRSRAKIYDLNDEQAEAIIQYHLRQFDNQSGYEPDEQD